MQTIKITLKPSGSVAELVQDFNIYQGSFNSFAINVAVPESILPKTIPLAEDLATVSVNIGAIGVTNTGKEYQTEKHNLAWKKDYTKDGVKYKLYGSTENDNLDDLTTYSGTTSLVINVLEIIQGENTQTPVKVITSQKCDLHIQPSAYLSNEKPIEVSELDKTNANVNHLLGIVNNLPLLGNITTHYNIADMPAGHTYTANGYNEPLSAYYYTSYTVPVSPGTTAAKKGVSIFSQIIPDTEFPDVTGYQTEYFVAEDVACARTSKYNISQINIGNVELLELGSWKLINQNYLYDIKTQADQNSIDIEKLYKYVDAGINYLGEYPAQEELPTDAQLNAYVSSSVSRAPQNGDEFTFVKTVPDGTDIIYLIKYSEVTENWTKTPYPTIESANNSNRGLVTGTNTEANAEELKSGIRKLLVDVESGEISDITHLNEVGQVESLTMHLNRNSGAIAVNTEAIEKNATAITAEITRATAAEQENATAITTETTRATEVEQTLKGEIDTEVARATAAEETNTAAITAEVTRATTQEARLDSVKLNKQNVNENYIQNITFALNGDTGVATMSYTNPMTGETQTSEITVTSPASTEITGLMTAEMVQALNQAVADIETLKYVGRQLQSFQTYADAQLYDWSTTPNIKVNDYFIVGEDESRTEPSEKGKTTKYVCTLLTTPVTTEKNFTYQMVVNTVFIQLATETELGGVLSTNTNGYVYVENTGAMKLVGYDGLLTSIANLTTSLTQETNRATAAEGVNTAAITAEEQRATAAEQANASNITTLTTSLNSEITRAKAAEEANATNIENEITRAKAAEEANTTAITAETTRATTAENNLNTTKANVSQIPTKVSQLTQDGDVQSLKEILLKMCVNRTTGTAFATLAELNAALVDGVRIKVGEYEETIGSEV